MKDNQFTLAAARSLALQRAWPSQASKVSFERTSAKALRFFGPLCPVASIGREQFEAWEQSMRLEGMASSTINRRKSSLLTCLRFAVASGHLERPPQIRRVAGS